MKASHILAFAISGTCATVGASETANFVREQTLIVRTQFEDCISFGADVSQLKQALQGVFEDAHEQGWDGYDAAPVTVGTFMAASAFLECLPLAAELPTVTAEPDGQISFEWYRSPSRLLSVSVSDDGKLHFAATIGQESDYGTRIFCGTVPSRIAELIAEVTSV